MPGIANATAVTFQNLSALANETTYSGLATRVNWQVYNGWLYFILLWVLVIILYLRLNDRQDNPLLNIMYASAAGTLISLIMRAVEITQDGVLRGLLADKQMWVFPIITILSAGIIWMSRDD